MNYFARRYAQILLSGTLLLIATVALCAAQAPDRSIRQTTEQLQGLIQQHHTEYAANRSKFYRMVDDIVVPRFDQQAIGRLVLGRHWRNASADQRSRFVAAFKNSLVYSYADALLEYYDTVKMEWKPVHMAQGAQDATVNVNLLRESGPPIPIGFSVRAVDNDWKVYDVTVEGVSLGSAFRSQFGAEIKKNGLDSLIARLEGGGKPLRHEGASWRHPREGGDPGVRRAALRTPGFPPSRERR